MAKKEIDLGINKFELFLLTLSLERKLHKFFTGKELSLEELIGVLSEFISRVGRKANKPWQGFFSTQALALTKLSVAVQKHGGVTMATIDLGITTKELLAMIPGLIGDIWPHYTDDKKITVDEGLLIASALFRALAEPTDNLYFKDFFNAQADALEAMAPLFDPMIDHEK